MVNVLLVEDDPITKEIVTKSIGKFFSFICCSSIAEAQAILDQDQAISMVIVDRRLPDGDGLRLCDSIRGDQRRQGTPVIFLTACESESDKLSGFFAGADDYITKPFSPLELKARILARLRARNGGQSLSAGRLAIDLEGHRVHQIDGQQTPVEIDLTRIEFKLLVTLALSLDKVLSRETLLHKVWGENCHVSDRAVDSHISHLRKKIAGAGLHLESLRGEGYRLAAVDVSNINQAA